MDAANQHILDIAHRGARSLAPENTLLAAQAGLDAGADMWELDVAMTADGELVVIHDDSLERTTNAREVYPSRAPWPVHNFTYEELRRLDFGSWYSARDPFGLIAQGDVTAHQLDAFTGLKVPTLREALEFTRMHNWRVNIEIKDLSGTSGHAHVVEKVVALVEVLGMAEMVLISSFQHDYLRQVKQLKPEIATAALVEQAIADPVLLLKELDAQAFNPALELVTDELVQQVRAAGFAVYVWTVNNPVEMRRLRDMKVSGIFTDFPQVLRLVLSEQLLS